MIPPLVLVFPMLASVHMQQIRSPGLQEANWLSREGLLNFSSLFFPEHEDVFLLPLPNSQRKYVEAEPTV
jgi:hypothetical protein